MKKFLSLIVILLITSIIDVRADTCDYKVLNSLKNEASHITVTYDIINVNNTYALEFSIYNITERLYVIYDVNGESQVVRYSNSKDGTYTFVDYNIDDIYSYEFTIKSTEIGCESNNIRTFSVKKPRRNKFYDNSECHFDQTADLFYCQEWVSQKFPYSDDKVLEIIKSTRKKTTTKVTEPIKEENDIIRVIRTKRFLAIVLLIIGIIIDTIYMIVKSRKIRKEREML